VASMVEVSQFAGSNRRLVVVLDSYPGPGHTISGEQITKVKILSKGKVLEFWDEVEKKSKLKDD